MKFEVVLRNLSPVFSADPQKVKVTADGDFVSAKERSAFACTRVRRLSVASTDTESGGFAIKDVPVVPGNTMRNLLRRTMLERIVLPQLKGNTLLSIEAYAGAFTGAANSKPEGSPATMSETVTIRNHPFLGLFGGGPRMIQGRMKVDTLYPIHRDCLRIIGDGYQEGMVSGQITDLVWLRRVDPITKLTEEDAAQVIQGGVDTAVQWVVDLLAASDAKKSKRAANDDEKTEPADAEEVAKGLGTFNAHEVVIPGIDWVFQINIDNPTPAQQGMILQAIAKMPALSLAGGHAKGYGRFKIKDVVVDGRPCWVNDYYSDDKLITAALDALDEALDELNGKDFEYFVESTDYRKAEKAKADKANGKAKGKGKTKANAEVA